MVYVATVDMHELEVTPYFYIDEIENIPKSEEAGYCVKELKEMVRIETAGNKNNILVAPANGFWKREGNVNYTYADRWPEQYNQFKNGNAQLAKGTPISSLRAFGITTEQEQLCKIRKVMSIEALYGMDQKSAANAFGMHVNDLKDMARKFIERGGDKALIDENAELRKRLEALEAKLSPKEETSELDTMSVDDLRAYIELKTEVKPDGRLSRENLLNMAKGL